MVAEINADAIACPENSGISTETDERFFKIREWFEFINDQQLKFGQYLAQVKEETKRQFPSCLEAVGLVKTQINKFIKAAKIADNLPDKLPPKLGLYVLLQLGQKRNEDAIPHLTEEDTQLSTAAKIKEHQKPPKPKMPKPVMEWEKNREGSRTLVLRLIDGEAALIIESGYKKSGLPLPLYLSSLVKGEPQTWQEMQEEVAQYVDAKSEEVEALVDEIRRCEKILSSLQSPATPTEHMMRRAVLEDKERAERLLAF
ncbi:hypothetical protein [Scytonema sp. PCC 10023]|uniref:hypothetical protein n=1 Tax=Scytonema sp. PCC 10023 TaxID=1680591 RepID=UPI0039C67C3C